MSININLKQILFQSQVRAKPLRENFTAIETGMNDIQNQINSVLTSALPDGTEVINARDYHTVLRERLRSTSKAPGNKLISGGIVTSSGSVVGAVDITAGEAVVNGVGCIWVDSTSGVISTCASGKHRVDVVYIDSSNALGILTGTETATTNNPVFPIPSSTQLSIAAYYVDQANAYLSLGAILPLTEDNNYPNICIASTTTMQGEVLCNNLFITGNGTVTLNNSNTGLYKGTKRQYKFLCTGNFVLSGNVTCSRFLNLYSSPNGEAGAMLTPGAGGTAGILNVSALNLSTTTGTDLLPRGFTFISGMGGIGGDGAQFAEAGKGGGGGASIIASGGTGGAVSDIGANGAHPAYTTYGAGAFIVIAQNIYLSGDITNDGQDGVFEATPTTIGGSGGGAGGIIALLAYDKIEDFTYGMSTLSCAGGAGAAGANNGSGGGGGAGGLIYITAKEIVSIPGTDITGGAGGLGGASSVFNSPGDAGSAGLVFQSENPLEWDILGFSTI